jgi:hypothetical protein
MRSLKIPAHFWTFRYESQCYPGSPNARPGFANCQSFAYEVLRHFGRAIPDFRSSELWNDAVHTFIVDRPEPLDLILFNRSREAFAAHVGVFVGDGSVLHLARRVGTPAVWSLAAFAEIPAYRVMVGAKRTRE